MKTLVLGLGNELYGDDGIGIQVIRLLKEEAKKMPAIAEKVKELLKKDED